MPETTESQASSHKVSYAASLDIAAAIEIVLTEFCLCPYPASIAVVNAILRGEIPYIEITPVPVPED